MMKFNEKYGNLIKIYGDLMNKYKKNKKKLHEIGSVQSDLDQTLSNFS